MRASDADCDGTLTVDDCDDGDPSSTVRADDGDCDGVPAADDCDDGDRGTVRVMMVIVTVFRRRTIVTTATH